MYEEDGGEAKCVNHGDEATSLPEPVLLGATETGCIVDGGYGLRKPLLPFQPCHGVHPRTTVHHLGAV